MSTLYSFRCAPCVIVVEGSGDFPIDMLRYDSCYPASEVDSAMMMHGEGLRQITLMCHRERGLKIATRDRWLSFTWRVIEEKKFV